VARVNNKEYVTDVVAANGLIIHLVVYTFAEAILAFRCYHTLTHCSQELCFDVSN
jgi:hypothetical protein